MGITESGSSMMGNGRGIYACISEEKVEIYRDEEIIKREQALDDQKVARRYLGQYNLFGGLLAECGFGKNADRYRRAKRTLEGPVYISG